MTIEEEVQELVDRIIGGDDSVNVTDIVRVINEHRDRNLVDERLITGFGRWVKEQRDSSSWKWGIK